MSSFESRVRALIEEGLSDIREQMLDVEPESTDLNPVLKNLNRLSRITQDVKSEVSRCEALLAQLTIAQKEESEEKGKDHKAERASHYSNVVANSVKVLDTVWDDAVDLVERTADKVMTAADMAIRAGVDAADVAQTAAMSRKISKEFKSVKDILSSIKSEVILQGGRPVQVSGIQDGFDELGKALDDSTASVLDAIQTCCQSMADRQSDANDKLDKINQKLNLLQPQSSSNNMLSILEKVNAMSGDLSALRRLL